MEEVIELARAKDVLGCDARMEVRSFPLMIPWGESAKKRCPAGRPCLVSALCFDLSKRTRWRRE